MLLLNDEEADKIRKTMLINGALNAKIVGQRPVTIAKMAGFEVPEDTKVLIGEATSTAPGRGFRSRKAHNYPWYVQVKEL